MVFQDREDAGRQLAQKLQPYRREKPYVIALPRGGVVVGYEVAKALNAPLDIIVTRKLGAPGQPELGMGAVAPNGVRILNPDIIRLMGVTERELEAITAQELREVARRQERYRGDLPMPDIENRTVLVVDDGLATGMTSMAAIRAICTMHPRKVVLAVPVAPPEAEKMVCREVDDFVWVEMPYDFMAVGAWYRDFKQVTDEAVIALLTRAKQQVKGAV